MGIKLEWPHLLKQEPQLIHVKPVDSIWPDPKFPIMEIVLSDQTASVQHMNFTGCASVYTSGAEFRTRILTKFVRENLMFSPKTLVLLWDKPWTTPRRAEMYASKRYHVPPLNTPIPIGKIRACDGRFYHPSMAPLPKFDPITGHGLKPEDAITEDKMYPLPQLLASSWTKILIAQFVCQSLWTFAIGRSEHFIFDTPYIKDDPLCDGKIHCNQGPTCQICLKNTTIPRHGEADVLFLYHIQYLKKHISSNGCFLVRGTNDRDLLAVLAVPFDQHNLSERIWWCKGTTSLAMNPNGQWVKPTEITGDITTNCYEFVSIQKTVALFTGKDNNLLTRLFLLFFFGGDYCSCPNGITQTGLLKAFFQPMTTIIFHDDKKLLLNITALHYFIQNALSNSIRCQTKINASNLLKCTLDAFYSLCYYTSFHNYGHEELGNPIGPLLTDFSYTLTGEYIENPALKILFEPLTGPILASADSTSPFLIMEI